MPVDFCWWWERSDLPPLKRLNYEEKAALFPFFASTSEGNIFTRIRSVSDGALMWLIIRFLWSIEEEGFTDETSLPVCGYVVLTGYFKCCGIGISLLILWMLTKWIYIYCSLMLLTWIQSIKAILDGDLRMTLHLLLDFSSCICWFLFRSQHCSCIYLNSSGTNCWGWIHIDRKYSAHSSHIRVRNSSSLRAEYALCLLSLVCSDRLSFPALIYLMY